MTDKLLEIHFSAVFHCITDQKQHKVGNLGVDPGESAIYKTPIVLLAFSFSQRHFYQKYKQKHVENQVFQAEAEMFH